MDEIVEGTVGTLHILAREAQSRSSIRAMKCMPLFVQVRLLSYLTSAALFKHTLLFLPYKVFAFINLFNVLADS